MPLLVFAVVILAALLHATWNAIVKAAGDKFLTTIMVTAAAAAMAALLLPFLTAPVRASWPYAAGSALLQILYFLLIARTYEVADLSLAYPLMRGTAPLLVALVSVIEMRDALSTVGWIGVVGISVGIFSMTLGGRFDRRKGIYPALLNACIIASYTLIDGAGVRRSQSPAAYTLWVFLLTGVPLTLWAIAIRRTTFISYLVRYWRIGMVGGAGAISSYGLALWAMTIAPVAVVAALRETSILFATLIAGLVLKERIGTRRVIAAGIIALSAIALRLA